MSKMQDLVDAVVAATLAKFSSIQLREDQLAVSLVNLASDTKSQCDSGHYRGDERIYPASVIKMFYLAAAHQWLDEGRLVDTAELRRSMHDMIVHSGNESTGYVIDALTDTTSGLELGPLELVAWHNKRNAMNRFFHARGYTDINANRKTWQEGPYGRDKQAVDLFIPGRNFLTTNMTVRLLVELATGTFISPARCAQMLELMKRDLINPPAEDCQAREFTGPGLPRDAKLWSKAGYMSAARHDAAIVELADGRQFALVVFTTRPDHTEIIPEVARLVVAGF